MALELQTFASGDTDYIAKLNSNVAEIMDSFTALEVQVQSVAGGDALTLGLFLDALFNRQDTIIGPESYKPTKSGSTLTVAPGGMYLLGEKAVVMSNSNVPLNFVGQAAGVHYIVVNSGGMPSRFSTQNTGTIYSVYWSGSSFGDVTYIAPVFFDTREANASRKSTVFAKDHLTLDSRFEAVETVAKDAKDDADTALEIAYDLQAAVGGVSIRKVGITVDGTTGVKGAIQIDFEGAIIGWSCIANVAGILQVEISRKASGAPPSVPQIPNPTTDKITGTAPIALASAQSASRSASGLTGWSTGLEKWDVIQFNVVLVNTIAHATMYLLIQEHLPSPPVINPQGVEFREGDA